MAVQSRPLLALRPSNDGWTASWLKACTHLSVLHDINVAVIPHTPQIFSHSFSLSHSTFFCHLQHVTSDKNLMCAASVVVVLSVQNVFICNKRLSCNLDDNIEVTPGVSVCAVH